jgi:hypothetical protein
MDGERTSGGEGRSHSAAMPRMYRDPENQPDPDMSTFALEVDGEQFAVAVVVNPATGYTDTGYTWLSGPNRDYGFGCGGGPPNPSREEHRQRIRNFLAMVDPTTGYIEDD